MGLILRHTRLHGVVLRRTSWILIELIDTSQRPLLIVMMVYFDGQRCGCDDGVERRAGRRFLVIAIIHLLLLWLLLHLG